MEAGAALDAGLATRLPEAERLAGVRRLEHYNLIRIEANGSHFALLHYPDFLDEPFPALSESWLVDLANGTVSHRSYADSLNPPILHRKELLLPADHPRRAEYAALTAAAESKRDQHAAHEADRLGHRVCERLGAAVDFIIDDENMLEVARWIVTNTPFDRLYFYGADLPIHVSFGPNQDRRIVYMAAAPSGRRVPRVIARARFLAPR